MKQKIKRTTSKTFPINYFFIIFCGMLCWSAILFTDYLLYDSWWTSYFLKNKDKFIYFEEICHAIARPLDILFFIPLTYFKEPVFAAKILGISIYILSAFLFSKTLEKGLRLEKLDSILVGCLAVSLPFFDLLGEICMFMYVAAPMFFWLAWSIALHVNWRLDAKCVVLRALILILFFFSFNLNSLLVLFYGFAGVLFLSKWQQDSENDFSKNLKEFVFKHLDLLLLPLVFWTWKSIFCHLGGIYAEWQYNKITLNPIILANGYASLLGMFGGEFYQVISSGWLPIFLISASATVGCYVLVKLGFPIFPFNVGSFQAAYRNLAYGLILTIAAAFPYAATGNVFADYGWETRNAVLIAFPAALLLFYFFKILKFWFFKKSSWFVCFLILTVVFSGAFLTNRSTLRLQAMGAKQLSIASKLKKAIGENSVRAVSLRDYFMIPGTIYFYPHVMWTYICTDFDSVPKVLVVDTRVAFPDQVKTKTDGSQEVVVPLVPFDDPTYDYFLKWADIQYRFAKPAESKLAATAIIEPGKYGNDGITIGLDYLKIKYSSGKEMPGFLSGLTRVTWVDSNRTSKIYE